MDDAAINERQWKQRRSAYYLALGVLFCAVAFYFGPNRMMFGKWTWITPADFTERAQRDGVPLIRAIKRYERDTGHRPTEIEQLVPKYLPDKIPGVVILGMDTDFSILTMYNHRITYDFDPKREGFYVNGVYTRGRIPLPPVQIESPPTTHPE